MTYTPWGLADYREQVSDGIVFYSTASHGGFHLNPQRNIKIPKKYRDFAAKWSKGWGSSWYEEDCAALAVIITYPEYFDNPDVDYYTKLLDSYIED